MECQWFLNCSREVVSFVDHPTLGKTGICQDHLDWVEELNWSGPAMVPPLVARSADKVKALMDQDWEE